MDAQKVEILRMLRNLLKKTQCSARVNCIVKDNDKLIVTCIDSNHNYTLEPQFPMLMSSNQEVTLHMKWLLEIEIFQVIELIKMKRR